MCAEPMETAFLSWLAKEMLPADQLFTLITEYQSGEAIYQAVMRKDSAITDILEEFRLKRLYSSGGEEKIKHYLELITCCGIQSITLLDSRFPEILKQITDPVSVLFYEGNPECLLNHTVGIFGSRRASYTGIKAAENISKNLSKNGIAVISGFAYGIDSAAHRGCLEGGSPTIAVMGCGLDQLYPAENTPMRKRILDGNGLLISEYPPEMKPLPQNFPYRNRIISALSEALILIEARIRSGSMTTVKHALDQGKELFVFPGDPASPLFEGNHQLLREGARFFTTAEDIMEDLKWLDNPRDQVQNSDCSETVKDLTPLEKKILEYLHNGIMSFEQIENRINIPPAEILAAISIMQIKGIIEPLPGKKYQIKSH